MQTDEDTIRKNRERAAAQSRRERIQTDHVNKSSDPYYDEVAIGLSLDSGHPMRHRDNRGDACQINKHAYPHGRRVCPIHGHAHTTSSSAAASIDGTARVSASCRDTAPSNHGYPPRIPTSNGTGNGGGTRAHPEVDSGRTTRPSQARDGGLQSEAGMQRVNHSLSISLSMNARGWSSFPCTSY